MGILYRILLYGAAFYAVYSSYLLQLFLFENVLRLFCVILNLLHMMREVHVFQYRNVIIYTSYIK